MSRQPNIGEKGHSEQKRFLTDLGHEIATPISAIFGFAVALVDGSVQTADDRAEAAGIVAEESDRLQRLLDDVRRLNSSTSPKAPAGSRSTSTSSAPKQPADSGPQPTPRMWPSAFTLGTCP